MIKEDKSPVLLFDGVCNLCVGSVQFILKYDKKGVLKLASLQSEYGLSKKNEYDIPENVDSLILLENGKAHYYSSAALKGAGHMGGVWTIFKAFLITPPFIRNGLYKWIANNRFSWFGKKEACWLPTPELKARFID